MKEIGGFFELELSKNMEYHGNLLRLNSARNAFKYILKVRKPTKIFIPNYICDSIIEPMKELSITYEFYNIDSNFEIIQDMQLLDNEMILYVNYFAFKSKYIKKLVNKYNDKVIVDNTHAFYEKPLENIVTIYSPRKLFGVSDGGYLSTNNYLEETFEYDESYSKSIHILGRLDKKASNFYADYQKAEQSMSNQPIKQMSKLTQNILSSIDYENIAKKRKENFTYLHKNLGNLNLLDIQDDFDFVPFVYPFMTKDSGLRQKLIMNKIYVAKYWNEVLLRNTITIVEKNFVNRIIPLPIDQRYNSIDMEKIVNLIKD